MLKISEVKFDVSKDDFKFEKGDVAKVLEIQENMAAVTAGGLDRSDRVEEQIYDRERQANVKALVMFDASQTPVIVTFAGRLFTELEEMDGDSAVFLNDLLSKQSPGAMVTVELARNDSNQDYSVSERFDILRVRRVPDTIFTLLRMNRVDLIEDIWDDEIEEYEEDEEEEVEEDQP